MENKNDSASKLNILNMSINLSKINLAYNDEGLLKFVIFNKTHTKTKFISELDKPGTPVNETTFAELPILLHSFTDNEDKMYHFPWLWLMVLKDFYADDFFVSDAAHKILTDNFLVKEYDFSDGKSTDVMRERMPIKRIIEIEEEFVSQQRIDKKNKEKHDAYVQKKKADEENLFDF